MGVPFSLSSFWAPTGHLDGLFWPLFEKYGPRKSEVYFGIVGAGGTACLYKGTFGFESFSPYANNKLIQEMSARNKRRLLMQRLGLGLLLLSFLLGVAHVFVE